MPALWQLLRGKATLATFWDVVAGVHGERPFLTTEPASTLGDADYDFVTLAERVATLAGALASLGVEPGDRIAICTANRIDYALLIFAVARLGAIAVPLHHHLTPGEAQRLSERARAKLVVSDAPIEGVRRIDAKGELTDAWRSAKPAKPAKLDPNATVAILFTSGTTGAPKGAELTSRSLLGVTRLAALWPDAHAELGVCALPLAHIMGLSSLIAAACAGSRLHFAGKFEAARVLHEIEKRRASFFVGVPAMYAMLLEAGAEKQNISSIKLWVSGADAMPPPHVERFRALGCALRSPLGEPLLSAAFAEVYGMVELSGPAILKLHPAIPAEGAPLTRTRKRLKDLVERVSSFGMPIPPYRVKVVGKDGKELKAGQPGELVIKGPGVTRGYDADPEATKKTTKDGWLHTGDIATRSRLGRVTFTAREKDVIKHGGYSVFPAEVETELRRHPAVKDVVVFGAKHATKGQVPVAAVIASGVTAGELVQWCRDNLAPYRAPRAVALVDELPRNATGKVLKGELEKSLTPGLRAAFPGAFG